MRKTSLKSILFIFILGILAGFHTKAQVNVDSLFNGLDTLKSDSAKISLLNTLAYDNTRRDFLAARIFADSAMKLSKKTNNQPGLSLAYLNIGTCYQYMSEFPIALQYFDSAKYIAEIFKDSVRLASVYNNIGL
ncbi:MAG: hypothetical protein K8S18_05845, partial [Desulfobacula sp.]|nr:hypothetical protein [Desulfobacula sp.]